VESDPESLFGITVKGQLRRMAVISHGNTTGNMTPELLAEPSHVGGQEKKARDLPQAISKSPRTLLLTERRKSYPRGGFMVGYHALPRGNHRIA
jgi:hypothetical protein